MLLDDERSSGFIETSAEQIESFVQQMAREYFLDVRDRRSEPRYHITVPVIAQRVGDDNDLVGPQVRAVTRDLSTGGIGLICQDPLDGKLIIRLASPSGTELNTLAQVLRCEANGYYFDVGGKFVRDV